MLNPCSRPAWKKSRGAGEVALFGLCIFLLTLARGSERFLGAGEEYDNCDPLEQELEEFKELHQGKETTAESWSLLHHDPLVAIKKAELQQARIYQENPMRYMLMQAEAEGRKLVLTPEQQKQFERDSAYSVKRAMRMEKLKRYGMGALVNGVDHTFVGRARRNFRKMPSELLLKARGAQQALAGEEEGGKKKKKKDKKKKSKKEKKDKKKDKKAKKRARVEANDQVDPAACEGQTQQQLYYCEVQDCPFQHTSKHETELHIDQHLKLLDIDNLDDVALRRKAGIRGSAKDFAHVARFA